MTNVEDLVRRNAEFAAEGFTVGPKLTVKATGNLTIIGCVDPRVDLTHILGLANGEAAVIRNPGGRVTPRTLRDMKLLNKVVAMKRGVTVDDTDEVWNLILVHHTDCGLSSLASDDELLADYFEIPVAELSARSVRDPYGSVRVDVDIVHRQVRRPNFFVSGLVYDVDTGVVEVVSPPTAVPTGR